MLYIGMPIFGLVPYLGRLTDLEGPARSSTFLSPLEVLTARLISWWRLVGDRFSRNQLPESSVSGRAASLVHLL